MASLPPPPYTAPVTHDNGNVSLDQLLDGSVHTFLLFDRSGSMVAPVSTKKFHISRWKALQEAAQAICGAVDKISPDGSTIVFFNDGLSTFENMKEDQIADLFADYQPESLTNLHDALAWTFKYIQRARRADPDFKSLIVVVTDGSPNMGEKEIKDDKDGKIIWSNEETKVAQLIANFTHYMEEEKMIDEQVGICLLQIGDNKRASQYLKYLDDRLKIPTYEGGFGAVFDIVSTVNFEGVEKAGGIVQALVNAFNK